MYNKALKILLFANNKNEADLIANNLIKKWKNCRITPITNHREFVYNLQKKQFDTVLSYYKVLDKEGIDIYNIFKKACQNIPFIFISDKIGEEKAINLLREGVSDIVYIQSLDELPESIVRAIQKSIGKEISLKDEKFFASIQNSLSGHIAVINKEGEIITTNNAWEVFVEKNKNTASFNNVSVGDNYLKAVKKAANNDKKIKEIYNGILKVANRKEEYFYMDYPYHSPIEEKWYTIRVTPLKGSENSIISHSNITDRVLAEKEVLKAYEKLELIANNIGEIVYKIRLDEEGKSIVEYISNNVKEIIGYSTDDYINGNPDLVQSMKPNQYKEAVAFNQMVRSSKVSKHFVFEYEWFHPKKKKWIWLKETLVPEIKNKKVIGQFGKVTDVTEIKKTESKIIENEKRLLEAQQIAQIGNWELNLKTNTLYWSNQNYKIFEVKKEEFGATYEYFLNLIHPEDRKKVNQAYRKHIKTQKPFAITHRVLLPSGKIKFIHEKCESIFDDSGRAIISKGTSQDITENKKIENIFEALSNTASTHGGDSYFVEITKELSKLLNVKYAFIGRKIKNKEAILTLGFSERGKTLPNFEYELKHTPCKLTVRNDINIIENNVQELYPKDFDLQKMGIVSYFGISLKDENEELGLIALLNDKPMQEIEFKNLVMDNIKNRTITEIKRLNFENLLKEREERFRGLIEYSTEITCIVDVNGKIKFISPSVKTSLGYNEKELIGKDIFDFIHPEYLIKAEENLRKCIDNSENIKYDIYLIKSKNEKYRYHRAIVTNHTDKKGIEGFIINAQDITDFIKSEKNRYFNIIKAEEDERIRIAHDLHDGLGQTIAAANMSMNAIDAIAKSELSKEAYSIFQTGKKLVNQATKETRMVSHNIMPRSLKEFGLDESVKGLISNYQSINKEIKFILKSNLNSKRFDEEIELTCFRVMQEAINNSVKYSKSKVIKIEIKLLGKRLFFEIKDEGIGFDIKKIKENRRYGLGLSSMKKRIETIGGELKIDSTPNNGTIVSVIIRLENNYFELN